MAIEGHGNWKHYGSGRFRNEAETNFHTQFDPGMVSIQAEVGAKVRIDLPPAPVVQNDPVAAAVPPPLFLIPGGRYTLEAVIIEAKKFTTALIYGGRLGALA